MKFLGFSLTKGIVIPCEDCLKTLSVMPLPKNKDQLRSALCTLRHYGVFCKGFSQLARCLYSLLQKDVRWLWIHTHTDAFNKLRAEISRGMLFRYDVTKPLFITYDASKDGLGLRLKSLRLKFPDEYFANHRWHFRSFNTFLP